MPSTPSNSRNGEATILLNRRNYVLYAEAIDIERNIPKLVEVAVKGFGPEGLIRLFNLKYNLHQSSLRSACAYAHRG